jgi:hypothetical protein
MHRIILACDLTGVLAVPAFGQGADPLVGTWKFNPENSKTSDPVAKNWHLTFTGEGQGVIVTFEGVADQRQPFKGTLTQIYDGMPYPTTGTTAYGSSAFTRVGNTINAVRFKNGKIVEVAQAVIVPGKTYTGTYDGIANNQPYQGVRVFDRQ